MIDASAAPLRPHFDGFVGPLLAVSFADDRLAPAEAVSDLASYYSRAAVFREHIDPHTVGVGSIGHFGFFRERARPALWERAAAWLREPSPRPLVTHE